MKEPRVSLLGSGLFSPLCYVNYDKYLNSDDNAILQSLLLRFFCFIFML